MTGWYYLHTNGDLIFKRFKPDDSAFVRKVWYINTEDRADGWQVILEGIALDAQLGRLKELAEKWNCTAKDLVQYMVHVKEPSTLLRKGLQGFLEKIHGVEPDTWFDWLEITPKGKQPDWNSMP